MFIHLGEETIIRTSEVVAIFDYEQLMSSEINLALAADLLDQMDDAEKKMIKSLVITESSLYLSPFSPATLKRRSQTTMTKMSC